MRNTERINNVQAVITRLAQNSFTIKGWSVALVTAVLGFAAKDGKPSLAYVAVYVIVVFGVLDSYYLALERKYRDLYQDAIRDADDERGMTAVRPGPKDLINALGSPSVWLIQFAALVATIAVAVFA